jgi:hypothetical protein
MKMLGACVVTAVLATTLSLGASVALFGEDNTVRETRDRHETEALMWKYTRALDKDHARYHAYYLTVSGAMGRETPPRIVAAGQSLDTMERVKGTWLLKTRDVSAKD